MSVRLARVGILLWRGFGRYSSNSSEVNMRIRCAASIFATVMWACPGVCQWTALDPIITIQHNNGLEVVFKSGAALKLEVCTESVIHVLYSPTGTFPKRTDYVVTKTSWAPAASKVEDSDKVATLSTA